ncbi:LuxR C-terminal-related transcriptional regulator [Chloroflexota bacterium]
MDKTKVMIIDKQAFFRVGVCQALSQQPDLELMDGDPGDDLIEVIEADSPDVLLLDIDFPSLSGLKLGRKLIRRYPNIRLIILSPNLDNGELFEIIKTGAVAHLEKNTSPEELANTIRQARRGEYPINDSLLAKPKVAEHVLRQFQDIVSMGKAMEAVTAPLTQRETQILTYIADGNSNKQIAHILEISEQTIKNHVSSILRKLNANDRAHAAVLAIRHGWISAEERN